MPDQGESAPIDPGKLVRELSQRFESLGRSGLDRLPIRVEPRSAVARSEPPEPVESTSPEAEEPTTPTRIERPTTLSPRPKRTVPAAPSLAGSLFEAEVESFGPVVPADDRLPILEAEAARVADCVRCPALVESRTRTVYGEGSPTARLMFLGEAPGENEDQTGRPFVGRAGQLLDDMITKGIGLRREEVYIANAIKCHPQENRDPTREEVAHCRGYLDRQIEVVRPEFLAVLGRIAAQSILDTALPLGRLRGRWQSYRGIPTVVTYHPAYLLRNPAGKREAWEDLKMLMLAMGIAPPESRKRS